MGADDGGVGNGGLVGEDAVAAPVEVQSRLSSTSNTDACALYLPHSDMATERRVLMDHALHAAEMWK